jgi:hypothetical protein
MDSLSVATVEAAGYLLGPMSVPSGSRNLISNCSCTPPDISEPPQRQQISGQKARNPGGTEKAGAQIWMRKDGSRNQGGWGGGRIIGVEGHGGSSTSS